MKLIISILCICVCFTAFSKPEQLQSARTMMFADSTSNGVPFSKDPHVIYFNNHYLMYYSTPPQTGGTGMVGGWGIGVARSKDLIDWEIVCKIRPSQECDKKGLCAPCARVIDGKVHLFYQTYGNGKKDAICHAVSSDGIQFDKDPSNPVFSPSGKWNCGRAIDAKVAFYQGKYFLYYATRDPEFKIQLQGVAMADSTTDFSRGQWTDMSLEKPIFAPAFPWEGECIEAASVIEKYGRLYMFYAGGYNNFPQQVGIAASDDGIEWKRLQNEPFLRNGKPGEWNSSESGHPHIFEAPDGRTYLFFQGNNDKGKTWYITNVEIVWENEYPQLKFLE